MKKIFLIPVLIILILFSTIVTPMLAQGRVMATIDPNDYIDQPSDPNPRQLVKLKNRYMADIKQLVEGGETKQNDDE